MPDDRDLLFLPTVNDRLRMAINILTTGPTRWGSDACGCEDCARLRVGSRVAAVAQINEALRVLGR